MLGIARIAGIMAAKRTDELIPLCHPLPLTSRASRPSSTSGPAAVALPAEAAARQTGVEMEALTAASAPR